MTADDNPVDQKARAKRVLAGKAKLRASKRKLNVLDDAPDIPETTQQTSALLWSALIPSQYPGLW